MSLKKSLEGVLQSPCAAATPLAQVLFLVQVLWVPPCLSACHEGVLQGRLALALEVARTALGAQGRRQRLSTRVLHFQALQSVRELLPFI
jgi:flagellar biosynthesis regulator FlbT